nr:virulence factor TspB C-terminal domain-related protein [Luteimonas sp. Y-2-2-4F]
MAGSCPTIPSIDVGGVSIPFDLAPLCTLLASLSYLVLALAYFMAFRIMAGG